jgi:predicted metalloprotease
MDQERESTNVEDRRSDGGLGGGGGGFGLPMGGAGRIGGLGLVAVIVLSLLFGVDPMQVLGGLEGGGMPAGYPQGEQQQQASGPAPPQDEIGRAHV